MAPRLGQVLRAGAIQSAILALRHAGSFTESDEPIFRTLRNRFAGITDRVINAVVSRVHDAYQSGVSYNRLRNPDSLPTNEPVDIRPALRDLYGAPDPLPGRSTNKQYVYTVEVTTSAPDVVNGGFQKYALNVTSERLLTNGELDSAASAAAADFLRLLANDYNRPGVNADVSVTQIRVIGAVLGYLFPSTSV